jgi:heme oxygenase
VIRAAGQDRHADAEGSPFMRDLLGGRLGVGAFALYTEQLWYVYRALEDGARRLAGDAVAGPFLRPELARVPALEEDLGRLLGPDWRDRSAPLPATARYAERIARAAATWPAGYVAHHYTRYLGDLSGGQVIRSVAERTWGLRAEGAGVRFYVFDAIPNPALFKREYRGHLDALHLTGEERVRMLEECRLAFGLNTEVLADLSAAHAPSRP